MVCHRLCRPDSIRDPPVNAAAATTTARVTGCNAAQCLITCTAPKVATGRKAPVATIRTLADRAFTDQVFRTLDPGLQHGKPSQTVDRFAACGSTAQRDKRQDNLQGASQAPVVGDGHQNRQDKNDRDHGIGPLGKSAQRWTCGLQGGLQRVGKHHRSGTCAKPLGGHPTGWTGAARLVRPGPVAPHERTARLHERARAAV